MAGGNYPGGLDSFTANTDDVDWVLGADINELQVAAVAVQTELGTDPAGDQTDVKTRLANSLSDSGYLKLKTATELTITSGAITVAQNYHKVDTEGDAASDYLDTINGGSAGLWIVLRNVADARDVVIRHDEDNIYCSGGADITLDTTDQFVFGLYDDGQSKWLLGKAQSGSDLTLTGSPANNYIAVFTDADTIEGTDDCQWDGTTFTIGDGTADRDYVLTFDGETNDGVLTWMEDEDYFQFGDDILIPSTERIYFRDTGIWIISAGDGHLDLRADVSIDLNTADDTDLILNFTGTTNSGVITWMEDEDYFQFGDGILMNSTEELYFRDTDIYIKSGADGHLDFHADISFDFNPPADVDCVLNFFGTTNAGVLTWMEDEDYFQFADVIVSDLSMFIGDTVNSKMTLGLTINQGANDNECISVKSSDVSHGFTGATEADTYGIIKKFSAANGGFRFEGYSAGSTGIGFEACETTNNTAKSTAAFGVLTLNANKLVGGVKGANDANANLLAARDFGSTRFVVDKEGDIHMDATSNINAWDEYDDAALLNGLRGSLLPDKAEMRAQFAEFIDYAKPILEKTGVVTYNEDGHHFISYKGMTYLMIDTMRQMFGKIQELEAKMKTL